MTRRRVVMLVAAAVVAATLIVVAYFVGRASGRQQFVDDCVTPTAVYLVDCPELRT